MGSYWLGSIFWDPKRGLNLVANPAVSEALEGLSPILVPKPWPSTDAILRDTHMSHSLNSLKGVIWEII